MAEHDQMTDLPSLHRLSHDRRLSELEELMERMPRGQDECGMWTPWALQVNERARALIADLRQAEAD